MWKKLVCGSLYKQRIPVMLAQALHKEAIECHHPQMRAQNLNEELQAAKESVKRARGRENTLKEEVDGLNQNLQRSQKTQRRLQTEKEEREQEIQELKQQIKRLSGALQVSVCVKNVEL